jgi:transcriptional regulator with XRE-family HTH domain
MPFKTPQEETRAKDIGSRIALARKEADGMTQRELADLLGVTERSVAAYEAGEVIPYRFMRQLEQLLNRPANWILYGEMPSDDDDIRRSLEALHTKLDELLSRT